jgi:magnesium-transporting ATPase (P-type)
LKQDKESKEYKDVYEYLVTLALCNACVIAKDPETGEIKYQAESPDEVALTLFASTDFIFLVP